MIRRIAVTSLLLSHFRNYASVEQAFSAAPIVLTGRNGVGKTNILEAVSLLTPGRGLRRARISEMDARLLPQFADGEQRQYHPGGSNSWAISALVEGMQGEARIGTGRDPENGEADKRMVKIDGKVSRSQAELGRHMAAIWLTPQMEQLFQEGASAGRKFLDRLVFSFEPGHASRVNEYEFAMRERNRLLQTGRADAVWLGALEQTMAETGCAIAQARLATCEHINHAVAASPLSFPKAHIAIHGLVEDWLAQGKAALEAEDAFKAALQAGRGLDAAAGRTLSGVHRSDMRVTHTEKHMSAEACSTGEQKAMLLSIVLAQARAGKEWHGVVPVLLLDEVAAHLDAVRRLELFEEICQIGAQAWMTGTDVTAFAGLEGKAQYFQVDNGVLI